MRLLFILLLVSSYAHGQSNGDTKIIVHGISFNQICVALLDSGYRIENKDAELETVGTEARIYPKYWNAGYKIYIRVKDSVAYLSGTFTAPFEDPFTKAVNKTDPLWKDDPLKHRVNKKGKELFSSMEGYGFGLIRKFALSFNKPVEYSK